MNRGIISEIFTKEQAQYHLDLIWQRAKRPRWSRLMNRPSIQGGIQKHFFKSRKAVHSLPGDWALCMCTNISVMPNLRHVWAGQMLLWKPSPGKPCSIQDIVNCGDTRQANCYYSSSDVTFKNRYEADERYDEIKTEKLLLKADGGFIPAGRIYIGLIGFPAAGLRVESRNVIIDPVIPYSMDGLSASINFMGIPHILYSTKEGNFSPKLFPLTVKPLRAPMKKTSTDRRGGDSCRWFPGNADQKNAVKIEL